MYYFPYDDDDDDDDKFTFILRELNIVRCAHGTQPDVLVSARMLLRTKSYRQILR